MELGCLSELPTPDLLQRMLTLKSVSLWLQQQQQHHLKIMCSSVMCALNTNPSKGVILIEMKGSWRAGHKHYNNFKICEKVMSNRCNSSQQENMQKTHEETELDENGAGLGARPRKLLVWLAQQIGMCASLACFFCLSIQLGFVSAEM